MGMERGSGVMQRSVNLVQFVREREVKSLSYPILSYFETNMKKGR